MRRPRRIGRTALLPGLMLLAAWPCAAQERGGRILTLDVGQRVEAASNRTLDPGGGDPDLLATTGLSLGLSSGTPSRALLLSVGGRLVADLASGDAARLEGPDAELSWTAETRGARLSLGLRYDRRDIAFLDRAALVALDDGAVVVPEDLDARAGSGPRESFGLDVRAEWGREAPAGARLTLARRGTRYSGTGDAALRDRTELEAEAAARLDLQPTLRATAALRYRLSEEGPAEADATGLAVALTHLRPGSEYLAGLDVTAAGGGRRVTLSGGLRQGLRGDGVLSMRLGATRLLSDETVLTGALSVDVRPRPRGTARLALERAVADEAGEGEVLRTALSARYSQALTRTTALRLDLGFARRDGRDAGTLETDARIAAQLERRLTPVWTLAAGVSRSIREDDTGHAASSAVFLSLDRAFRTRF